MSEEPSSSFFSITGKTGRVSYFFQNSILMLFGFQYIYGSYLGEIILKLQHNPLFKNAFMLLQSDPLYSDMLQDLNRPPQAVSSNLMLKFAFLLALRIVDLKRVRDIVNRKLGALETALIVIVFSLPFVDLISTIFLVTLPPKKNSPNQLLSDAHAVDKKQAHRERLIKMNKDLFESGKISKAEYLQALEKLQQT